jgi:hypothetical protein
MLYSDFKFYDKNRCTTIVKETAVEMLCQTHLYVLKIISYHGISQSGYNYRINI